MMTDDFDEAEGLEHFTPPTTPGKHPLVFWVERTPVVLNTHVATPVRPRLSPWQERFVVEMVERAEFDKQTEEIRRLNKAMERLFSEIRVNTDKSFYEHCHGKVIRIIETGK